MTQKVSIYLIHVNVNDGSSAFLQGPVPHRPPGRGEAHERERPARGPLCRGDPPSGQGLPVRGDPRRSLPRQLDSRVPNGELHHE